MRKDIDHLNMMRTLDNRNVQTYMDLIVELQNEITELKSKLIK